MKSNSKSTTSKYKHNSKAAQSNLTLHEKVYLLPIIFILAILPFIMRLYQYDTGLSVFKWFSDDDTKIDVFLFYKEVFFIIASVIILGLLLYKVIQDKMKLRFSFHLLPIFIYGLLALLSTLFSDYSSYGFTGIYEQFESIFVILGYCLLIYYAFLFIQSEDDVRFILKYLIISVLVMGVLGFTQYIGHDFIASELGTRLVMPSKFIGKLGLDFNFGPNRVYLTLYNPNYVGVYVALIVPLLNGLLITEKNRNRISLYVAALVGMLISLIGSKSKTSLLSLVFAFILVLYFFRKYIFRKTKLMISIISLCGVTIILLFVLNFNTITNTFNTLFHITKSAPTLSDIKTDDTITLTYNENVLIINMESESNNLTIKMTDSDEKIITYSLDNATNEYVINDQRFTGIQVTPVMYDNKICLDVKINKKDWIFTNQLGDNTFYYLNSIGKFDKINTADSAFFTGYESFASGRGYLWSRTIPLLKDNVILGSGADTFSIVFPQQDYVNMYNAGFDGQLITRPHNMYLQMGVQSGVISLIAFLAFYIMYFISSIRLYWKGNFNNFYSQAGVSIFIGTVAYMIAGITNDSTITVAPVFWGLIGIGIAINYKLKHIDNVAINK